MFIKKLKYCWLWTIVCLSLIHICVLAQLIVLSLRYIIKLNLCKLWTQRCVNYGSYGKISHGGWTVPTIIDHLMCNCSARRQLYFYICLWFVCLLVFVQYLKNCVKFSTLVCIIQLVLRLHSNTCLLYTSRCV